MKCIVTNVIYTFWKLRRLWKSCIDLEKCCKRLQYGINVYLHPYIHIGEEKRLKWLGSGLALVCTIARRSNGRWTKEALELYPRGVKRSHKRPNSRWVDEIRR